MDFFFNVPLVYKPFLPLHSIRSQIFNFWYIFRSVVFLLVYDVQIFEKQVSVTAGIHNVMLFALTAFVE